MAVRPSRWLRLVLAAGAGVGLAAVTVSATMVPAMSDGAHPGLAEYADVLTAIQAWHADEVPTDRLVYSSIRGMLETLDPHTSFFEPERYGSLGEKQHGSYFGLGLVVSKRAGKLVVVTPVDGSSPERLGVRAGDVIARIDGESTEPLSLPEASQRLRGPKGTTVRLTVVRPGLERPLEIAATRAEISTHSVTFAFLLRPGVGYIRLSDFTETSTREFLEAWDRLERQQMRSLVFDLRGNPGGLLAAATGISDAFLRKGERIVYTEGRSGAVQQSFAAPGRSTRSRIPVVVLVDNGSASGSEIVAGALQDHDRALVVGQTTWGKGLVQSVFALTDGAGLAVTTARYYTPSGRCIQRDYRDLLEYLSPEEDTEREPASSRKAFQTDGGRMVYGGGGIAPDAAVHPEPLSSFLAGLYARGAFFEFAVDYRARTPVIPRDFRTTAALREELFKFLERRATADAPSPRAGYVPERDSAALDTALLEEILNAAHGREAGFAATLETDPEVQKALALLPEAGRLAAGARKPAQLASR